MNYLPHMAKPSKAFSVDLQKQKRIEISAVAMWDITSLSCFCFINFLN
jgi:hypothetical protein